MTPCEKDRRATKAAGKERDWTGSAQRLSKDDVVEMTTICRTQCPIRQACYRAALAEKPLTEGVWAGLLWRRGRPVDVRPAARKRRSVYPGVTWDGRKERWKAWAQTSGPHESRRSTHIGYFDDEAEAAAAVEQWHRDQRDGGDGGSHQGSGRQRRVRRGAGEGRSAG